MGSELKAQIATALDIQYEDGFNQSSGDRLIEQAIRLQIDNHGVQDINPHLTAAHMICRAMPQAESIDNFIDGHRDNTLIADCGKLSIARCILAAELASSMRVGIRDIYNNINFAELENTWYNAFFKTLVHGCQFSDMAERLSRVAIITFNYDRCIEHYLHSAFQNYYGVEVVEATELMRHLSIYHPYGYLGALRWEDTCRGIKFGAEVNATQLREIAARIKTFTEGTDESHSEIIEIRSTIKNANRVAYLGFAFNPQNLSLLYGNGATTSAATNSVVGTAYGLSPSDVELIGSELAQLGGATPENLKLRRDLTCEMLFHEFGRSLSLRKI